MARYVEVKHPRMRPLFPDRASPGIVALCNDANALPRGISTLTLFAQGAGDSGKKRKGGALPPARVKARREPLALEYEYNVYRVTRDIFGSNETRVAGPCTTELEANSAAWAYACKQERVPWKRDDLYQKLEIKRSVK